jgi:hypothetical protein
MRVRHETESYVNFSVVERLVIGFWAQVDLRDREDRKDVSRERTVRGPFT